MESVLPDYAATMSSHDTVASSHDNVASKYAVEVMVQAACAASFS